MDLQQPRTSSAEIDLYLPYQLTKPSLPLNLTSPIHPQENLDIHRGGVILEFEIPTAATASLAGRLTSPSPPFLGGVTGISLGDYPRLLVPILRGD